MTNHHETLRELLDRLNLPHLTVGDQAYDLAHAFLRAEMESEWREGYDAGADDAKAGRRLP
jgi:hypothetical protein